MPIVPMRGVKGFALEFILDVSCWYNPKEIGDHWNKLLGVTQAFSWNDCNACMGAWAPMPERGLFSIAGYVNYPCKEKGWRVLGEIEAKQRGRIECYFNLGRAHFSMGDMDASLDFEPPSLVRQVGMYFGGRPKSPQWMQIEAAINYET